MAEFDTAEDDLLDESMMSRARVMAVEIGDPFLVLRAAIELFGDMPSASLSDAALSDDVIHLRRRIGQLEAIFAEYALGSHRRGVCGHDAMRSTPAWLAWQTGLGRGQVSRAIATADLAELLPAMGAAWKAGRVSTNAMEAIAAARVPGHDEKLAACEEEFLGLAQRGDHKGVRRAAEAFKHLARADGTEPIEPDGLRLSKVLDGRTNVSGELSGDAAETVTTALNAFMDPPSETDDRSPAQRRADAFVRICQIALQQGAAGVRAAANVTVIVDWATFTNGGLGLMDGQYSGPIDRRDINRLLCDSTISRVIIGPGSKPLDVGRGQRAFTDAQRTAIHARDQDCAFPGCEIPGGWCEVHHHTHWKDGGETCLENGCLLCPHHHRFLHRHPDWQTTFHEQVLRIYRPDGTELTPEPWNTLAA